MSRLSTYGETAIAEFWTNNMLKFSDPVNVIAPTPSSGKKFTLAPLNNLEAPKKSGLPAWWSDFITCRMGPKALIGKGLGHKEKATMSELRSIPVRWFIQITAFDLKCFNELKRNAIERFSKGAEPWRQQRAWETKVSRLCPVALLSSGDLTLGQILFEGKEEELGIRSVLPTLPFSNGIKQDPTWRTTFEAMTVCMAQCATELYAEKLALFGNDEDELLKTLQGGEGKG